MKGRARCAALRRLMKAEALFRSRNPEFEPEPAGGHAEERRRAENLVAVPPFPPLYSVSSV
jgi:hypothetical protein